MDIQTWAAAATIIASLIAVLTLILHKFDKFDTRIDRAAAEARADIKATRDELKKEINLQAGGVKE